MNDFFIVFQEIFKQDFMIKALITGIFIAISCSLLGVFLVLKNMSLIGDGLAHVSFAAIAIGLLVSDKPIIISISIVIVASFLVLLLKKKAKIERKLEGKDGNLVFGWDVIDAAYEMEDMFLLYVNKDAALVLGKKHFVEGDNETLRKMIKYCMIPGKKGKIKFKSYIKKNKLQEENKQELTND